MNIFKRIKNLYKLSEIESLEEFENKRKLGLFKNKKLATFIETKSEVEKLEEIIKSENNG